MCRERRFGCCFFTLFLFLFIFLDFLISFSPFFFSFSIFGVPYGFLVRMLLFFLRSGLKSTGVFSRFSLQGKREKKNVSLCFFNVQKKKKRGGVAQRKVQDGGNTFVISRNRTTETESEKKSKPSRDEGNSLIWSTLQKSDKIFFFFLSG